ncbi:MAG: hypothetical protein FWE08_08445 [Oscillospiraceae bacterium]|nr:hypothetical protein [Oscillospiraceae bacterium]
MRKIIALILAAVLLIGILGGCSLFFLDDDRPAETPAPATPTPERELPTVGAERDPVEFEIVRDLTGLNLIDHDLGNSALLELAALRAVLGREIADIVILSVGDFDESNGFIFSNSESWAVGLFYFAMRHTTAADTVIRSLEIDMDDGFIEPDSILTVGPVRTAADGETASLAVLEENIFGDVFLHIYLAQNVPDSTEVVLLDILIVIGFLEEEDHRILTELSTHLGIDLHAYIEAFAGHLLPDEVF